MQFAKYQGAGNDFVVVDLRDVDSARAEAIQDPAAVRAVCDRQFGVGGDGVLAILPPTTAGAVARMRVLNADGSEAEMCGNGIRCVAIELRDHLGVTTPQMTIDTGAGPLPCELRGAGADASVTVAMGAPRLLRGEIPMTGVAGERCIDQPLTVGGHELRVTCVSMGNPHAIAFVASRATAWKLATTIGTLVEHHAWFPRRTNSEFAHVRNRREIDLVVWERGCGITLACGTGACATAVAALLTDRCDRGVELAVHLPGGTLGIRVADDNVYMRGPARRAFAGVVDPSLLARRPAQ